MRLDLDLPDKLVGDQVMAAIVLNDGATLSPSHFEDFLASQPDLSPKAWPRYVRINDTLPQTATNKFLKRTLIQEGVTAGDGALWERQPRGREFKAVGPRGHPTRDDRTRTTSA